MKRRRNVLVGVGEVGYAICDLMDEAKEPYIGIDKVPSRHREFGNDGPVELLHVCIPYDGEFESTVSRMVSEAHPQEVVIHSTVKPHTTERVQRQVSCPVIFSPIRGVHSRMLMDLKRYTKYYACILPGTNKYRDWLARMKIKGKSMSSPLALEYAKLLADTTYYGWLILYAQHTKEICDSEGLNWDEVWEFSDDIHELLGNRPKMYPGTGIEGHCILPNLELLEDEYLDTVFGHDARYRRKFRESRALL